MRIVAGNGQGGREELTAMRLCARHVITLFFCQIDIKLNWEFYSYISTQHFCKLMTLHPSGQPHRLLPIATTFSAQQQYRNRESTGFI